MSRQVALVTGGSRGIGFACCLQLAKKGYLVYCGCRDVAATTAAFAETNAASSAGKIEVIQLDVTNQESVDAAAKVVAQQGDGILDVLVNNAGYIAGSFNFEPEKRINADVSATQKEFDVNYFGVIRTTTAFLPLLEKSTVGARIVNVSSTLASIAEQRDPTSQLYTLGTLGYNGSKAALNMYTAMMAQALAPKGIKINAVHPGWVKTEIGTDAAPLSTEEGAELVLTLVLDVDKDKATPNGGFYFNGIHLRY